MTAAFIHLPDNIEKIIQDWLPEKVETIKCTLPFQQTDLLSKDTVFILHFPIKVHAHYFAPTSFWLDFLNQSFPNARLLISGFENHESPISYYLDLLNLPSEASSFMQQLPTISEIKTAPNLPHKDLKKEFFRFFEGHGAESFIDELDKIKRITKIADDEYRHHEEPYDEIYMGLIKPAHLSEKWNVLQNRRAYYFPLFEALPFYEEFEHIGEWMDNIHPYFETDCSSEALFNDLKIVGQLEKIKTNLQHLSRYKHDPIA